MKKITISLFFIVLLIGVFFIVNAQEAFLNPDVGKVGIPEFLSGFYKFAIMISGILAVGMIVVGGIYITLSGASPDKKNEGKSMILGALWGLALVLGAYLILKTLNPGLILLEGPGKGILQVATYEKCSSSTVVISEQGGIKTSKPLDACKSYEYPIDETGECKCYIDKEWITLYIMQSYDTPEGVGDPNFKCDNQQKLTGTRAAATILEMARKLKGTVTYKYGATRPDQGFSDCSGFTSYLYNCVVGVHLGNTAAMNDNPMPEMLERLMSKDHDTESMAIPGDIIGMNVGCKRKYKSGAGNGHAMIVAEKDGNQITKVLHVVGGNGKTGNPFEQGMASFIYDAFKDCGYLIHNK